MLRLRHILDAYIGLLADSPFTEISDLAETRYGLHVIKVEEPVRGDIARQTHRDRPDCDSLFFLSFKGSLEMDVSPAIHLAPAVLIAD